MQHPRLQAAPPAVHRHAVQFYQDEAFLCNAVADFAAAGLAAGQPVLVIATAGHRQLVLELLAGRGVEVARARMSGQLSLLDAHATLDAFMGHDGMPDAGRFREVIGRALTLACRGREDATVRAFGEMVDVLWRAGNAGGALRLEAMWNELAEERAFTLLCGYAMGSFQNAADAHAFGLICAQHDHVLPTEAHQQLDEAARLRRISELEQRALALQTELEHRLHLEGRLRAAAAEAEAANRAKSEFLAVMSHELRTPLNAIGGYAELLEMEIRGPVTPEQRRDLVRIQHSQRHLLALVNEVLNYARLESGTVDYVLADVPAAEALYGAAALVAPLARARELRLVVEACDPEVRVRADEEKLRQVLVNLLSNAIKFTRPGGRVRLACSAGAGDARFTVSDTGIGIPADRLKGIFEPFVQVRSDLTREHDGAGLGLAISRSVAEAMGGTLHAESEGEGRGSAFHLRLPAA